MSLTPPAMGDRYATSRCWRCDAVNVQMFKDPMMFSNDMIGVCVECAPERFAMGVAYRTLGRGFKVNPAAG